MKIKFTLFAMVSVLGLSSLALAAPHGIYPTTQQRQLFKQLGLTVPTDAEKKLYYYGGPVLANVEVYAVMWGPSVNSDTQKGVNDFYTAAINSSYFDWLKEYNTNVNALDGRAGSNQTIGRGKFMGQIVITPANTSTSLQDADVQKELDAQIAAGVLPKPNANTLFMTYFPPGVSIAIDGQGSCSTFCAYHEGFTSPTNGNVFYGVMPDLGGACAFGCGFNSPFDNLTIVSSHEMTEAVTDPFPTPKDKPAYPQAWNTTDGSEIGDLCAQTQTNLTTQGTTYLLQQEFDNSITGCASGPYQSP
jgi:hypothetical protein